MSNGYGRVQQKIVHVLQKYPDLQILTSMLCALVYINDELDIAVRTLIVTAPDNFPPDKWRISVRRACKLLDDDIINGWVSPGRGRRHRWQIAPEHRDDSKRAEYADWSKLVEDM